MRRAIIWIGGLALLAGTFIDTISVIGRHVGLPFRGSIELMQMLVLVSGGTSILVATLWQQHARVRLLVDRLSPKLRSLADRFSDFASALFFIALLAGSIWLSADLWNGFEQSELLGISWRWMRLFANICLGVAALVVLWRAFVHSEGDAGEGE